MAKITKRQPICSNFLICAFLLLLACTPTASHDNLIVESSHQQDQMDARTYVYECDNGYRFVARHQNQKVWLFLPEKTISLPQVPSGSGAKYRENQIIYWSKGDEALLELKDVKQLKYKNNHTVAIWEDAKFRGVDFRAVGNEPGWNLEIIKSEKIVFFGNYGQERFEFIATDPSVDQKTRTTVYSAQTEEHEIAVRIVGRSCRDTMSGEAFETTVTVILDAKKYHGCGKALH